MRDGLHRVTNHSSGEGTRDVDRTNASNGGLCASTCRVGDFVRL
jgi:hypothetical protein